MSLQHLVMAITCLMASRSSGSWSCSVQCLAYSPNKGHQAVVDHQKQQLVWLCPSSAGVARGDWVVMQHGSITADICNHFAITPHPRRIWAQRSMARDMHIPAIMPWHARMDAITVLLMRRAVLSTFTGRCAQT